ncbi:MAG TPA: hypothetical protein VN999_16255, partial [Thermoanaerobaculia bacterium]|nr:hypothetical protein [Thermoanaerobaculia bacterium]
MLHLLSAVTLLAALQGPPITPSPVPAVAAPAPVQAAAAATPVQPAKPAASAAVPAAGLPAKVAAEKVRRRFDHPAEAQEFFLRKRLPQGQTVLPMERYFAARERMQAMRQHSTPARSFLPSRSEVRAGAVLPKSASGWTELGPGNVGGRTLAMVIDPADANTIYAGTADGGIWKTTDGQNWAPIGDLFPSLAIGSLAMDPSNSSVLYAGTGEGSFNGDSVRGAGVFQTVDAG